MKGTVKFYSIQKNYGFIEPDEGDEDLFVHRNEIVEGNLSEDDRVEFEKEQGEKGPKAVNVKEIAEEESEVVEEESEVVEEESEVVEEESE